MSDQIDEFLAKVDAFAATLDVEEQVMFARLVGDDTGDDVAGFNLIDPWPIHVHDLAPIKIEGLRSDFATAMQGGTRFNGAAGDEKAM